MSRAKSDMPTQRTTCHRLSLTPTARLTGVCQTTPKPPRLAFRPLCQADGYMRGFTLLEILIALAILAIALAAAMRVAGIATNTTTLAKQRIIAQWVAQNHLTELRLAPVWTPLGITTGDVQQAGLALQWEITINGTPNPNFRRAEIRVFAPEQPNDALADLVAYLPSPPP